jgi:hypothetical protein
MALIVGLAAQKFAAGAAGDGEAGGTAVGGDRHPL